MSVFFFKQKTAYDRRISDWSSDVCSSDLTPTGLLRRLARAGVADPTMLDDPDEALRQGYYFSPASAHYQAMFEVADDALQLPAGDVQDWLELAPTERAPWLERGDLRASAALLLLADRKSTRLNSSH